MDLKNLVNVNDDKNWFVYLLLCADSSLYCGITKNLNQRFLLHVNGKGAKYTRGRGPLKLVWKSHKPVSHSEALALERKIKKLPKQKKTLLIKESEITGEIF